MKVIINQYVTPSLVIHTIFENDYFASDQGRRHLGVDVSLASQAGDRTVDGPGRNQLVAAQDSNEGVRLRMAKGGDGPQALALAAATPQERHLGVDVNSIEENKRCGR